MGKKFLIEVGHDDHLTVQRVTGLQEMPRDKLGSHRVWLDGPVVTGTSEREAELRRQVAKLEAELKFTKSELTKCSARYADLRRRVEEFSAQFLADELGV